MQRWKLWAAGFLLNCPHIQFSIRDRHPQPSLTGRGGVSILRKVEEPHNYEQT